MSLQQSAVDSFLHLNTYLWPLTLTLTCLVLWWTRPHSDAIAAVLHFSTSQEIGWGVYVSEITFLCWV